MQGFGNDLREQVFPAAYRLGEAIQFGMVQERDKGAFLCVGQNASV